MGRMPPHSNITPDPRHTQRASLPIRTAVVLITVSFLLMGLDKVNEATDPLYEDTHAFLQLALFLRDHGGILDFVNMCLNGTYMANVQKPLYPLLLSTFATRDLVFFPEARLLSLLMATSTLLLTWHATRRMYGDTVALLAAALLSLNATFLEIASHVQCESTLMFFLMASLFSMMHGLKEERYWTAAGGLGGLAYLSKGTGLLLLPVFAAGTWLALGAAAFKRGLFWWFFIAFLLTTSPLIVRNILIYGNPVHESMNAHAVWMDRWEDVSLPEYQVLKSYPEVVWEGTDLPTMSSYLASHSAAEIFHRMVWGIAAEFNLLQRSVEPILVGPQLNKFLLLLCAIGLFYERRTPRLRYVLVLIPAFFFPLSFSNQSVPAIRFIAVLTPVLCLYAAVGCTRLINELSALVPTHLSLPPLDRWIPIATGFCFFTVGSYALWTQQVYWPERPVPLSDGAEEFSRWVQTHVQPKDLIALRTDMPFWAYSWHVGLRGKITVWNQYHSSFKNSSVDRFNQMLMNPRANSRRFLVVHKDDLRHMAFLNRYLVYTDTDGLLVVRPIAGWTPIYRHSQRPAAFLIYQVEAGATSPAPQTEATPAVSSRDTAGNRSAIP